MTNTYSRHGVVWLDMSSPDEGEIANIVKRYDLNPLVGEELLTPSSSSKVEFYDDYMFVVLTLPIRKKVGKTHVIAGREIDFVIGKNFIITSRFDTIEQIEHFAKIFETSAILDKDNDGKEHAGHIFYYMVRKLYSGMIEDLENIRDSLGDAESKIFTGTEKRMVEVLSELNRELIDYKQAARTHKDIWEEMIERFPAEIFGKEYVLQVKRVRDDFMKVHELVANARELLTDLRETNDSLLNTKQNEIMKFLTLFAFIFYPLSFLAALFTIPAVSVPIISSPSGWNVIVIIMIALTLGMLGLFRNKKWL